MQNSVLKLQREEFYNKFRSDYIYEIINARRQMWVYEQPCEPETQTPNEDTIEVRQKYQAVVEKI